MLIIKDCKMPSGCVECPCCEEAYTTGIPFCKALEYKPDISDATRRRDDCPLHEMSELITKKKMNEMVSAVTSLSELLTRSMTQYLETHKEGSADE